MTLTKRKKYVSIYKPNSSADEYYISTIEIPSPIESAVNSVQKELETLKNIVTVLKAH